MLKCQLFWSTRLVTVLLNFQCSYLDHVDYVLFYIKLSDLQSCEIQLFLPVDVKDVHVFKNVLYSDDRYFVIIFQCSDHVEYVVYIITYKVVPAGDAMSLIKVFNFN